VEECKGYKIKNASMQYFSMFSWLGDFEIPLQEIGWECIGFSEMDKYAVPI
jgi:site-specific DNA-cytosine methylase